jgi:protein-S-isoprenylcysteine O-methyltransferase Ste14
LLYSAGPEAFLDLMIQPLDTQRHPDALRRLGGWLFARRTWLPLPIAAVILMTPAPPPAIPVLAIGIAFVVTGELLRLWAVRHIGVISRTRSERLGPLVATGPFAIVRNPLYIGNALLWIGFTVSAGLPWLVPFVGVLLGAEYHAIVRWEEGLLDARMGDDYRKYASVVPRWFPRHLELRTSGVQGGFSWRETFFSERGTLMAIAAGYLLLWVKSGVI